MNETILSVRQLKKSYPIRKGLFSKTTGYIHAVKDVSFELQRGTILGLVGESGCGKTTVGKTILGLVRPNAGAVYFEDQVLFDVEADRRLNNKQVNEIRKEMQVVFQDPFACLDPRMTILQIVTEGMRKHLKLSKMERKDRAESLLESVGLSAEALYKYPHQFSGGQRQRIGIARALSLDPKLIICDEPTAALDVSIQSQILNLMLELKQKHELSYLFISHNLAVVENFCDQIAVMYLGEIVESGPSSEIFGKPCHPYTLGLLHSAPDFDRSRGRVELLITGELPSASELLSGCSFHPRCKHALDRCRTEKPSLRQLANRHLVACHRAEELRNDR